MPSGLIDEEDGVGSWCDRVGDFREVQVHRFGIAGGQDQSRALAQFRADGTEDIGRCGSLIPRGARASAALRPPAGDLVLLADTSLVLEPDFYLADVDRFFACRRRSLFRARLHPGALGIFFKILDCSLGLRIMAGAWVEPLGAPPPQRPPPHLLFAPG